MEESSSTAAVTGGPAADKPEQEVAMWRCDVCNDACFEKHEDCVAHEKNCNAAPAAAGGGCGVSETDGKSAAAAEGENDVELFRGRAAFPLNLAHMLESAERMGLSHIFRWSDDGRGFVIHDDESFVNELYPKFFV